MPAAPIIVLWILIGFALLNNSSGGPGPTARAREINASLNRVQVGLAETRTAAYLQTEAPSQGWRSEIEQLSALVTDEEGRGLTEAFRSALSLHQQALTVVQRNPSNHSIEDRQAEVRAFDRVTAARLAFEAQRATWLSTEQAQARQGNTWFTLIFLVGSVVAVIGGLWMSVRLMRDITQRVERVAVGADALSKGEVVTLPDLGADEIGTLGRRLMTILQLLRHREAELATKNEDLAIVNRELEAFSYSISHDLRAPLRAIAGFSQIIAEDAGPRLDPSALNALQRVRAATERMGVLIDDLLNLSRVARLPVHVGRVDLTVIAHDVLARLSEAEPSRNVKVSIQEDMIVDGDPALLKIVLENLLGNAWKYTARTLSPEISMRAEDVAHLSSVTVRDNGAGFDMSHAKHLFGVFQRMHTQKEFEGTGVGLAIVQRLIHRHGGSITAEAHVHQGATFTFVLPRREHQE